MIYVTYKYRIFWEQQINITPSLSLLHIPISVSQENLEKKNNPQIFYDFTIDNNVTGIYFDAKAHGLILGIYLLFSQSLDLDSHSDRSTTRIHTPTQTSICSATLKLSQQAFRVKTEFNHNLVNTWPCSEWRFQGRWNVQTLKCCHT